ncbi:MAG: hypothetical protein GF388_08140 [Candidatus Aegiribacteria sp.]|nr:hypothetical protein [Candidatus Aegiribacteria sp.]MBD3295058.1 hypothetical protein [Candidatus Fermentibacteria bacterium]
MSLLHITLLVTAASTGMNGGVWNRIHPEMEKAIVSDSAETEAMLETALDTLWSMDAESVFFCSFYRIEAPLGGYLLDGLFSLKAGDREYRTFRIGVGDSGGVFTFFARGTTESDSVIWLPEAGPDWYDGSNVPPPEGALNYEFLFLGNMGREHFESLEDRFKIP